MALVECHGLEVGYGPAKAIRCPDFSVGTDGFLCVIGPNGAGKTALVKTIAGLLPPLAGEIRAADGLHNGGIGYLPQRSPLQDDFPATVREIVRTGCQARRGLRPFFSRTERDMAEAAMARFGLTGLAKRPYRALSGGQRQRTLLARALCIPRRLLLLDEPTAGLDQDAIAELYGSLEAIHADGLAVVMVTHERSPIRRLATHVLRLGERAGFIAMPAKSEASDA